MGEATRQLREQIAELAEEVRKLREQLAHQPHPCAPWWQYYPHYVPPYVQPTYTWPVVTWCTTTTNTALPPPTIQVNLP